MIFYVAATRHCNVSHLKHTFDVHIVNGHKKTGEMMPAGCLKRATLTEMFQWIFKAWQSIFQDIIPKIFEWLLASLIRWMEAGHWSSEENC
jgi:hypothetical protein